MQRQSKTYNIRLQVTVEVGSLEEFVLEYLNDESARPFGKAQMLMTALKPFWSSLALLNRKLPHERVVQALRDGRYLWELHEQYLRERIEDTLPGSSQPDSGLDKVDAAKGVLTLNPTTNTAQDSEQMLQTDSVRPLPIRNDEANPVKVEVVEDEMAADKRGPYNPFGDGVIIRN